MIQMGAQTGEKKVVIKSEQQLRKFVEELARRKTAVSLEASDTMSQAEMRKTLYELRLHQIELEMQNEELRSMQQALDNARARYFDLYDRAPVGYCTVSLTGLILEPNLTIAAMLGIDRLALMRTPSTSHIFNEDQDSYYLYRKKLFETGEPQQSELRMVKADNSVFWVQLTATVAKNAEGAPVCRLVIIDISQRKLIEEELRLKDELFAKLSSNRFNQLAKHSKAYRWEIDVDGLFVYIDDNCKSVLGYDAQEIIGKKYFYDLYPESEREVRKTAMFELFGRKTSFKDREGLIQTANGRYLRIATDGFPVLDSRGGLSGYRGMDINITAC